MKPMMPPPVPYCVAFELRVVKSSAIGAAEQRAARQSWRKRENMVVDWLVVWCRVECVGFSNACSRLLVLCRCLGTVGNS